ncbi:sulfatase-like hydrolase/transferase [bacterium]|nr:sulfatase-like hydrolase/transferase [bacterium]
MARPDRPNIVWLLTDHHVFAHHYFLPGPRPALPTYERLAREGVAFTNAYAVCPLCTPARASMLTGVYPHRHEMVMNNGDCGSRLDFEPDARLFSHYMNDAGYRCGYFGKWHVGDERGPLDYGFEGWSQLGYGHPYWDDDYAAYLDELGLPQATVDVEWHFADPTRIAKGIRLKDEPNWHQRMECAGRLTTPVETHEAYYLTHRASQWLERVAHDGDPFCLRVDVWGPHQPYWVAEPFAGTANPRDIPEYPSFAHDLADRPEQHRRFAQSRREHSVAKTWEDWQPVVARSYEHATQVDAALGRVLDTLDRLAVARACGRNRKPLYGHLYVRVRLHDHVRISPLNAFLMLPENTPARRASSVMMSRTTAASTAGMYSGAPLPNTSLSSSPRVSKSW